jgi:DNA-binding CsgD family transcriptional regulator
MTNRLITAKSVLADTLYRAGSTVVNVRPEGLANDKFEAAKPFVFMFEAIVCYDNKMNIVWANGYARHLFGLTEEQIKTGKCYEMFYKKQSHCAGCPVIRTIETGNEHMVKVTASDGKIMLVRSYPMKDENGCVCGTVAITQNSSNQLLHQDVTDAYMFGSRISLLTGREQEVMQLVAEGCSNKLIGTKLGISSKTVEIHRARVMDKLQIHSTAQLVRYLTKYEIFGRFLTE